MTDRTGLTYRTANWTFEPTVVNRAEPGHYPALQHFEEHRDSRILRLKLDRNMDLGDGVKTLLRKSEDLYLEGLESTKNVLAELDLSHLKRLHVKKGTQVQYIPMKKTEF